VSPKAAPSAIEVAYRDLHKSGVPDASELASAFVSSVEQLEKQLRGRGPFYPGKRTALANPDGIRKKRRLAETDDLAAMLWEPTRFKVGRRSELDFYYVDRELIAARSVTSSGKPQITGSKLSLDLLLANANPADRTPIVAEAKLGYDKDPEAALVQGLAYAAHLGTRRQLARLGDLYPDYFADRHKPTPPTRLDIYVITHKMPPSRKPALRRAVGLAKEILSHAGAAQRLRRIAFLDAYLTSSTLRFRCLAPPYETSSP
jgi:hypothetical protein